jgi:hypothetical protein
LVLEGYFVILPVFAAISLSLLGLRDRTHLGFAMIATTLAMVSLDLAPDHPGEPRSGRVGVSEDGRSIELASPPRWPAPGALRTVASCGFDGACLRALRDSEGRIQRPGLRQGLAYYKVFFLLSPPIILITSAAVVRWIDHSVLFSDSSAEWVVEGIATWAFPLFALGGVAYFSKQALLRVLAHGSSPVILAYPYLGMLCIAGLAWISLSPGDPDG